MGSYKKVCEYCKKEFIVKDSRVKYCSDECRYNSRMNNKKVFIKYVNIVVKNLQHIVIKQNIVL